MLPEAEYNHFMLLSIATRICSCNAYKRYLSIAKTLFELYVKNYINIYGRHCIGSNVHNLIHITEDMKRCGVGNLMEISTYKFENSLRMLTLNIKRTNRPLEQAVRRTVEKENIDQTSHKINSFDSTDFIPKTLCEFHDENRLLFRKIEIAPGVHISSNRNTNNSWFLTKSNDIIKMLYAQNCEIGLKVYGLKVKDKRPLFKVPIDSSVLDIYESDVHLEDEISVYSVDFIKAKMMCIGDKKRVFIPLLHTLELLNKNKF